MKYNKELLKIIAMETHREKEAAAISKRKNTWDELQEWQRISFIVDAKRIYRIMIQVKKTLKGIKSTS